MDVELLDRAITSTTETAEIEFKNPFDTSSKGEWLEILKDLLALANSGGGALAFGLDDNGDPSGEDVGPIAEFDPAKIVDKIESVTGVEFARFRMHLREKGGQPVAILLIGPSDVPIPFRKTGQYHVPGRKYPAIAFHEGTTYFRHGAKSAPGTYNDLNIAIDRRLEQIRSDWLSGVQKVVNAPEGSLVQVLPPEVRLSESPEATPMRFVDDPSAPGYRFLNPNESHPYRLTDVLELVKDQSFTSKDLNWYDIFAARKANDIEGKPDMFFDPKYGSPQYSDRFLRWLLDSYERDPEFFTRARKALRKSSGS